MLIICFSLIVLVLVLLRAAFKKYVRPGSQLQTAVLITLSFAAAGAIAGFGADLYADDQLHKNFAMQAGLTVIPVLGWLILIGSAANAQSRILESNLREAILRLSWYRARINLVNWYDNGQLSRLLHGEVQSALHFGIAKYEGGSSSSNRYKTLEEMQDQIRNAFAKKPSLVDLEQLTKELAEFWSGICELKFDFSDQAIEALDRDQIAMSISWDLIKEASANSIRHGKATEVSILLRLRERDLIELQVANNGAAPQAETSTGLGSTMFNSCTTEWRLENGPEGIRLKAMIPVLATKN